MTKRPKAPTAVPHEPCRHDSAFVATLLSTSVDGIFACGPDFDEEGDEHLLLSISQQVDGLVSHLSGDDDGSDAFAAYRRRVTICAEVLAGKRTAPPRSMWARVVKEYGRGIYLTVKAHQRRPHA